jgi:hypothetical protein
MDPDWIRINFKCWIRIQSIRIHSSAVFERELASFIDFEYPSFCILISYLVGFSTNCKIRTGRYKNSLKNVRKQIIVKKCKRLLDPDVMGPHPEPDPDSKRYRTYPEPSGSE